MFLVVLLTLGGFYVLLLLGLLTATAARLIDDWAPAVETLRTPELRYAFWLSVISCTLAATASVVVAIPVGYVMARYRFPGKVVLDTLFDIPIVLPPLVVGVCLLILFAWTVTIPAPFGWFGGDDGIWYQGRILEDLWRAVSTWLLQYTPLGGALRWLWEDLFQLPYRESLFTGVTYAVPAIVLGQFTVACAFAVRTTRLTFQQIDRRPEQVALTLGASRGQAFRRIALPQARRGAVAAFTLAWARSLGEFGPILVFAGTTRMRTEVLSSSVFLELNVGNLAGAVAISALMIALAVVVLIAARLLGALGDSDSGGPL